MLSRTLLRSTPASSPLLRGLTTSTSPLLRGLTTSTSPLLSRGGGGGGSKFSRPSPPPLPPADQAEFDALLKANQSIGATPAITDPNSSSAANPSGASAADQLEQHPNLRKGGKKDFEGDINPVTGEQGGPKVDPFKAGNADWQYGGRITDF